MMVLDTTKNASNAWGRIRQVALDMIIIIIIMIILIATMIILLLIIAIIITVTGHATSMTRTTSSIR